MTRHAGLEGSELLRQLLDRNRSELTQVITDVVLKTVKALFGQRMYAVTGRTGRDGPLCYAASVVLQQGPSCFRLRLAFDSTLLKTLIVGVYPLDAANSDDALGDVVAEMSDIIAGHVKTFINQKGFDVSRDLPVVETAAASADVTVGSFSLNFSIFRNALSVRNLLNVSLL